MVATRMREGKQDVVDVYHTLLAGNERVGLFTAPSSVPDTKVLSDMTAATFTGYAAQAPVYAASSLDANNNAQATAAALTFTCSGSGSPQTILGWYKWNNLTGKLVDAELFSAPIVISTSGQFIVVTPTDYQTEGKTPL